MLTVEQLERIVFDLFTDENCVEAIGFALFKLDETVTNVLSYYNKINLREKYAKWDSSGISVDILPPYTCKHNLSTGLLGGIETSYSVEELAITLMTRDNYSVYVSTFVDENENEQVGLFVNNFPNNEWSYNIFSTESLEGPSFIRFSADVNLTEESLTTMPLILTGSHISLIRYKLTKELARISAIVNA